MRQHAEVPERVKRGGLEMSYWQSGLDHRCRAERVFSRFSLLLWQRVLPILSVLAVRCQFGCPSLACRLKRIVAEN